MRKTKAAIERIKQSWRVLSGKSRVQEDEFPYRIVQILNWRDELIALDGTGRIYRMRSDWSGFMYIELVMENPVRP